MATEEEVTTTMEAKGARAAMEQLQPRQGMLKRMSEISESNLSLASLGEKNWVNTDVIYSFRHQTLPCSFM